MCLICDKVFRNGIMKLSKMEDHLSRQHTDKIGKHLSFREALQEKLEKRLSIGSMFASSSMQVVDDLRASYKTSLLIAKSGNLHTIGEQLFSALMAEVINNVLHTHGIIKRINSFEQ